ncbi:MAG: radical SAM protein [Bacteroidales bacterium]|nr:radical SAM protein [Bacteroidales bacterium]
MLFNNIVVGPIHSRRLGTSLGVNVLPTEKKYCSFNCIYCECGWNEVDTRIKVPFNDRNAIKSELEAWCNENSEENRAKVTSITFSGNGEPTLHPEILGITQDVIMLRNKFMPQAKVTILTNSTTLSRPDVWQALHLIDNPLLKIDAGTQRMYNLISKPVSADFEQIKADIIRFGRDCVIQTMLLRGENDGEIIDNTTDEEFLPYLEVVKQTNPREVMLYSLDRVPPAKNLVKVEKEELEKYADIIRALGIKATAY